jgi:hypothetical protein
VDNCDLDPTVIYTSQIYLVSNSAIGVKGMGGINPSLWISDIPNHTGYARLNLWVNGVRNRVG